MLKFGTIGSGWITDEFIHGAKDSGLWQLAAVYSRTKERGDEYAKKHGAELVFTDLTEMAECDELDAVYVASPNAFHYEHSKLMLEHGKNVICEKPLCAQAEKVRELQALAEKNGVVYLEAIMYMHLPQRKILEEALGKIGKITMAKIDFCQRSSKLDPYLAGNLPNIFNPKMETGGLMDLGVYCVYPALSLFGKPDSYQVQFSQMDTGVDGSGVITMKYPDKLVTLCYSKLGQTGTGSDFQGTDGTVSVGSISKLENISLWRKDGTTEQLYGGDEKYQLMGHEAKDFYRYITEPEQTRDEYERCKLLSVEVAEFMENARKQGGILFESDK